MHINTILLSGTKIFAAAAAMALNVVLARFLDPHEYGAIALWLTYLNILGLILIFGMNSSHIFFFRHKVDNSSSLVSIYFFICLMALLPILGWSLRSDIAWAIAGGLALGGVSILNADAQAREKFVEYALQVVLLAMLVNFSIAAIVVVWNVESAEEVIKFYALQLIAFFTVLALVKKKVSVLALFGFSKAKAFLSYGVKGVTLNILGQGLYFIDIVMLGFLMDKQSVAYYAVAGLVAKTLWLFIDAVGTVLFPSIVSGEQWEKKNKTIQSIKLSFMLCLMPSLLFVLVGHLVVPLVFGPEYVAAVVPSYILILASFPLILYKIGSRFAASNDSWNVAYLSLGGAVLLNFIFNLLLIPMFGIVGAAVSSLIAYIYCGLSLVRKLGVFKK